ncbi:MAG: isoprenylcysteine carboxylmethyltransferase family protein [Nitriliruptoraceae bacterium]
MDRRTIGWLLVAGQAALLGALVLSPMGELWPTPSWLEWTGLVLGALGGLWAIAAGLRLGDRLTPTPVPRDGGHLRTNGPYAHVRHPIYTGVLLIVVGLTLRSGSGLVLALAVVTVTFFHFKARFEEGLLAERYPEYHSYAARTPRFVPAPWRRLADDQR